MTVDLRLEGDRLRPVLRVRFPYTDEAARGLVKKLDHQWDKATKTWSVTSLGPDPGATLRGLGAATPPALPDGTPATRLTTPIADTDPGQPGRIRVWHRLAGPTHTTTRLLPGATDTRQGWCDCDPLALLDRDGRPVPGIDITPGALHQAQIAWEARVAQPRRHHYQRGVSEAVAELAATADPVDAEPFHGTVAAAPVPDWFGLRLYPYQAIAATAILHGHTFLADDPGAGKTRAALAVAAARDPRRRTLILCPPVVTPHWAAETTQAHLARPTQKWAWLPHDTAHPDTSPAGTGATLVVWQAGRVKPDPPDAGVLLVPDTLLDARAVDRLAAWAPDLIVYDEAHRLRGGDTKRARNLLDLVHRVRAGANPRVMFLPLTGTPFLSGSPADLLPALTATGHADWVFAGPANYLRRYTTTDPWGGRPARRDQLPALRRLLNLHVWVRRDKKTILPNLPPKTHQVQTVAGDLAAVDTERRAIVDTLRTWVTNNTGPDGRPPDDALIHDHAVQTAVTLLSRMRIETGLLKVPAAVDWAEDRVAAGPDPGTGLWEQPVTLWVWSRAVTDALLAALPDVPVRTIDGRTGAAARARAVADLQDGTAAVLVAQIAAAGVGVTLTRCSDALFVETDWVPENIRQAEDRHHRPGSERPVTYTRLHAPGTLDDRMWRVQHGKTAAAATVLSPGARDPWEGWGVTDTSPASIVEALIRRIVAGDDDSALLGLI